MPQLGTADVTYGRVEAAAMASPSVPMKQHQFNMLFPNGTNVLYTQGGIPLNLGQLGCPAGLIKFIIEDAASSTGYVPKWDQLANTIRLYAQTTSAVVGAQLAEVSTAATVASVTLRVLAQGW